MPSTQDYLLLLGAADSRNPHRAAKMAISVAERMKKAQPNQAAKILRRAEQMLAHPSVTALEKVVSRDGAPLLTARTPKHALSDLVLDWFTEDTLRFFLAEQAKADDLDAVGLRPRSRLLFKGPSGCGKTAAAGAIAQALDIPFVTVRLDTLFGSYLGESGRHLRSVFDYLDGNRVVLLLDEIDGAARDRSMSQSDKSSAEVARVVNSLLMLLDEIDTRSILIGTTNLPELIDSAAARRFDVALTFSPPDEEARGELVSRLDTKLDLELTTWGRADLISAPTSNHAELQALCEDAARVAIVGGLNKTDAVKAAIERFTQAKKG